jgi:hypothetical protein
VSEMAVCAYGFSTGTLAAPPHSSQGVWSAAEPHVIEEGLAALGQQPSVLPGAARCHPLVTGIPREALLDRFIDATD